MDDLTKLDVCLCPSNTIITNLLRCAKERFLLGIGSRASVYVLAVVVSDLVHILHVQRLCWSIRVAIRKIDANRPSERQECGERDGDLPCFF
jgi:hypothetical protein